MNISPLQLDVNCFHNTSHYHSAYYSDTTSNWPSSSLLCPSTTINYQTSSISNALQSIDNYCSPDSFYQSKIEPIASSSESSFYSSPQYLSAPPPGHFYISDNFIVPSSSTSIMLPQNRANYTRHQLVMLNEIFKKHKYPNSLQKTLIAKYIGVSRDQIRIWFQNKRRKVQLINKGQAKQTKTDVECEFGEYRRHLPKNFLDDLFQELHKARGAPARLPVKRDNNQKSNNTEHDQHHHHHQQQQQQQQQTMYYYPTMNSTYFYQSNNMIEQDDSSHEQTDEQYLINYNSQYSDRS